MLLLKREELPGGLPNLGEAELDASDRPLVPQPELADELQLLVEAGLLEGPPRRHVRLARHDRRHGAGKRSPAQNGGITGL